MHETFSPGAHGCDEALLVASMIGDMVDNQLCAHPAILMVPQLYAPVERGRDGLFELMPGSVLANHLALIDRTRPGSGRRRNGRYNFLKQPRGVQCRYTASAADPS